MYWLCNSGSWFLNPLRLSDFCPITYKQNYQNGSYNFEVFWVQISTTFEQKNPTKILEDFLFEMQNSNGLWKDWDLGTFLGQFLGQYLGNIWGNFWGNIWAISGAISRAVSGAIFWAISYNSYPFFFKFQDSNGSWKGWTGRYCGHSCPRRFSNVCGSVPRIWYNSCIRSSRRRQCRLRPRQLSRHRPRRPRGRRHWSRRPQRQWHSLQFRVIY